MLKVLVATMDCPFCRHANPEDTNFCGKCGSPLSLQGETAAYTPDTMRAFLQDIQPGTVLAERYEVIEVLGRGGMGTVFKVHDRKIKETVALKLIRPEIALSAVTRERFRNELKLARKITHKNICRMYDLGEDGPLHFITMEYIAGQDLKRMMRMTGQLSPGSALTITRQVCEGLAEAHRLGIIHRDLKPQNVMIDPDGNVKIMDFGIARSLYEKGMTGTGVLVGSPEYMSPEQAEAGDVDQRTDIYALGVIIYEMVTGRVPFTGDTPLSIAIKHKHENPIDPCELNALVPPGLSRIILRCLDKNTTRRYRDMPELIQALTRIEKGIPTVERVIPRRKTLVDKPITVTFKPRRLLIPVLALILITAAGILIGRRWFKTKSDPLGAVAPVVETARSSRSGRPGSSPSPWSISAESPDGRRFYTVPTPQVPLNPEQLEGLTAAVPDFMRKLVGAATELTAEEITELATIQSLMRFLNIDPTGWIDRTGDDNLSRYTETLEKMISSLERDSPYKPDWNEIRQILNQGRALVREGKAAEAETFFKKAKAGINRLYSQIMIRQRAERMQDSARKSYASTSRQAQGGVPLQSLEALLAEADEKKRNQDYESASALFQLAAEVGSLALRAESDQALARELSEMAQSRRRVLEARRPGLSGELEVLFTSGREAESEAFRRATRRQYRDAAESSLRACIAYEKIRLNL